MEEGGGAEGELDWRGKRREVRGGDVRRLHNIVNQLHS